MSDFVSLMLLPALACVVLVGMHTYFGLHVLERGVIFVDLALSQLAALGATLGILAGWPLHSVPSYVCAFGFTLAGAIVFSATRRRDPVVPQEALVGFTYAFAAAASILVLSRSPEGSEELKSLLVGHLLFVDSTEVMAIFGFYSLVGVAHWLARRPILMISRTPEAAYREKVPVAKWDFFFYASFGLVVTSSTEIAGVLLVFSFLIVPAMCGMLLGSGVRQRLLIGWICGLVTSIGGLGASYTFDLPTGAAIVCVFALTLTLCWLFRIRAAPAPIRI